MTVGAKQEEHPNSLTRQQHLMGRRDEQNVPLLRPMRPMPRLPSLAQQTTQHRQLLPHSLAHHHSHPSHPSSSLPFPSLPSGDCCSRVLAAPLLLSLRHQSSSLGSRVSRARGDRCSPVIQSVQHSATQRDACLPHQDDREHPRTCCPAGTVSLTRESTRVADGDFLIRCRGW